MSHFGQAVQTAIFNRLNSVVLPDNVPVYTVVPDEVKPPAVVIAESQVEPLGVKGGVAAESHLVTVRTLMTGTSKARLLAVMRAVTQALDNVALPPPAGVKFSDPVVTAEDDIRDVDSAYLIGSQFFLVWACAAA